MEPFPLPDLWDVAFITSRKGKLNILFVRTAGH